MNERGFAGWVFAGGCLLAAACVVLGDFHREDHADALLPVLVSLQRWTPFFWGQNRFGMLVPLLALPVRSPLWNLLVQEGLDLFAGLAAFGLVARHAFKDRWLPIGASAGALFLALAPREAQADLLGSAQPYGVALALGFAGLVALEGASLRPSSWRRLAAGAALMSLGSWVNLALAQTTLPYVALVTLARLPGSGTWRERVRAVALGPPGAEALAILFGSGVGRFLAWRSVGEGITRFGATAPSEWLSGWGALGHRAGELFAQTPWATTMLALGLVGLLGCAARRARPPAVLIALLGTGAASFAVVGTLRWVQINEYHPRYLLPAVPLFAVAMLGSLWTALPRPPPGRTFGVVLAALLLAGAVAGHGWPSLQATREAISAEPLLEPLQRSDPTYLAGSYWRVVPIVFRVLAARHQAGDGRPLYALTDRSRPVLELARRAPSQRIALLSSEDGEAERWLREYGLWPVRPLGELAPGAASLRWAEP